MHHGTWTSTNNRIHNDWQLDSESQTVLFSQMIQCSYVGAVFHCAGAGSLCPLSAGLHQSLSVIGHAGAGGSHAGASLNLLHSEPYCFTTVLLFLTPLSSRWVKTNMINLSWQCSHLLYSPLEFTV
jgi:hypothetical protein